MLLFVSNIEPVTANIINRTYKYTQRHTGTYVLIHATAAYTSRTASATTRPSRNYPRNNVLTCALDHAPTALEPLRSRFGTTHRSVHPSVHARLPSCPKFRHILT